MSPPKARKGDAIVCSKGHRVGHFTADVPDGEPVPTKALHLDYAVGRGYVCEQCGEPFAHREGEDRWRVRTLRGWVS